jgi:hypothetical protein
LLREYKEKLWIKLLPKVKIKLIIWCFRGRRKIMNRMIQE